MPMGAQILIVEDNEANCELMRYLLQAYGHTVVTARDGATGLASAQRWRPDLILCDIQMPGMDGTQLARHIRQDRALDGIVLLAVTALAMVGDREVIMAAGFDGYFAKPIAPATFVQEVQAFLPAALRGSRGDIGHAMPASPRVPRYRATILVVDDRRENLQLAGGLFGRCGYFVRTASGMCEALDELSRCLPDLILSDVVMSDGSGYELIRRVKTDERLRRIPFVFITSTLTAESDRRKGLALGAAQFIFRPLEPQALLAAVNGCLHQRL
jgi:two-component system cell cycle response regulator